MIGPSQDDIILLLGHSSCQSRMIAVFGTKYCFEKQNPVYHPGDHLGSDSRFSFALLKTCLRHPSRILHSTNFFDHTVQKFESSWHSSAEATNRISSWHHPAILLQLGPWFEVILVSSCQSTHHPDTIPVPWCHPSLLNRSLYIPAAFL